MQNLPHAKLYEEAVQYMPWRLTLEKVGSIVTTAAPKKGKVLDLFCGPGTLIRKIEAKRQDVFCLGVDLDPGFIRYTSKHSRLAAFVSDDVLSWNP